MSETRKKKVYAEDVLTFVCMMCDSHIEMCDGCGIKEAILDAPDADEECAEWVKSSEKGYVVCSNCVDCFIPKEYVTDCKWNYCPNCGSKMRKKAQKGGKK